MCGVLGVFSTTNNLNKELFIRTLDKLNHRGPNDNGFENFSLKEWRNFNWA